MTVTTDRPASNAPDAVAHGGAARLAPASRAPHSSRGKVKLAPLAYWTEADVNAYSNATTCRSTR
jgi:3'-phosphoadenosine 5'-phosphosulfate sulfotransferase (PAPS reductase)/FAD synthetase